MDWADRVHRRRRAHHGREQLVTELLEDLDEAVETIQAQAATIQEQQSTIGLLELTVAELVAEVDRLTHPPAPIPTRLIIRTTILPKD